MDRGGALVESMPFDRRVAGSNSSPRTDLGQVLYLQLPVALRRVNSDTVSIAVIGSASEGLMLWEEIDKYSRPLQYNNMTYCSLKLCPARRHIQSTVISSQPHPFQSSLKLKQRSVKMAGWRPISQESKGPLFRGKEVVSLINVRYSLTRLSNDSRSVELKRSW